MEERRGRRLIGETPPFPPGTEEGRRTEIEFGGTVFFAIAAKRGKFYFRFVANKLRKTLVTRRDPRMKNLESGPWIDFPRGLFSPRGEQ